MKVYPGFSGSLQGMSDIVYVIIVETAITKVSNCWELGGVKESSLTIEHSGLWLCSKHWKSPWNHTCYDNTVLHVWKREQNPSLPLCHFILSENMSLGCLSVSRMRLHKNRLCSFFFISVSSDLRSSSCHKVREDNTLFCTNSFLGSVTRCQYP